MKRSIMKFTLQKASNNGLRCGVIEMKKTTTKTMETPFCMLYTRGGSAPHLTKDMLHKVQDLPPVANMALCMLAEHHEAIGEYGEGVAKFAAMEDFLVFASLHDSSTEIPSGYNERSGTALWTKGGKLKVDVEHFMKLSSSLLPDWCQSLSDQDTNVESSRKRTKKAVDRTLTFLDQILEQQSKTERLKDMKLFGVVEGGYFLDERERSARETATRPVAGFVIEGFHSMGPKSEDFHLDEVEKILRATLKCLPVDKPRLMQGIWPPDAVLQAVHIGIDVFDSCYPYMVTERGGALMFRHDYTQPIYPESRDQNTDTKGFEISLKDKMYFDDFSPILKQCTCYTCQRFTRAYVNHLLNTSELLAGVLLMIHNFHHYLQFFKSVRQALSEDKFEALLTLINSQKR